LNSSPHSGDEISQASDIHTKILSKSIKNTKRKIGIDDKIILEIT